MNTIRDWLTRALARLGPLQRKALGLGVIALLGGAVFFNFFSTNKDRVAIASVLRDPLSVFGDRSPGARLGGALFQTKQRRAATQRTRPIAPGTVPHERVLAMTRARPGAPVGPLGDAAPNLALLGRPEPMFVGPGIPVSSGAPQFDVPGFNFGDAPGFAIAPGEPQGPAQPGVPQPNSPGSAVSEAATWLMMILGIGAAGRALRRQCKAVVPFIAP